MFNELETAIFAWFKQHYPDCNLTAQLDSAELTVRQWTRVGFFVNFNVDRNLSKLEMEKCGGRFPIDGPVIKSNDIDMGGGSLLWVKDGYLEFLEMYAFGHYFHEEVKAFELFDYYIYPDEFLTTPRKP